jgi:hypothetical protein
MVAQNEKLFVIAFSLFNEAGPPRQIDEDAADSQLKSLPPDFKLPNISSGP